MPIGRQYSTKEPSPPVSKKANSGLDDGYVEQLASVKLGISTDRMRHMSNRTSMGATPDSPRDDVASQPPDTPRDEVALLSGTSDVTPLMLASRYGHHKAVKVLLESGASVNQKELNGWSSLHRAASAGHIKVMKLLRDCYMTGSRL